MKYKYLLTIFLMIASVNLRAQSEEITLFNSQGKAIAYIAQAPLNKIFYLLIAYIATEDMTIYMWGGKPVAYLTNDDGKFNIYGFNGKHLGWFIKGILRDHEGDVAGFIKDAVNITTEYEPYKNYKQYKPYKSYKESSPYLPYLSNNFSKTPLSLFLEEGVDN